MSHEISGSDKMKDKCQTIACLSEDEIAQIAGGASYYLGWWIRGIPAFDVINGGYQNPTVVVGQQTIGF